MDMYSAMNEQITDILRRSDNPASLYAAARIEELEAKRDVLAATFSDANELHSEARNELERLREACEFVEATLAPYRGDDACPNRAYTVSREAIKSLRAALRQRGATARA